MKFYLLFQCSPSRQNMHIIAIPDISVNKLVACFNTYQRDILISVVSLYVSMSLIYLCVHTATDTLHVLLDKWRCPKDEGLR